VLFLVMEFVEGQSLDALVRERGPLPAALACEMMRQAGLALQYAHEKRMVHRDIKPANLLIARGAALAGGGFAPLVKIVDFGLARLHNTAQAQTLQLHSDKSFIGTPDYVAPEQARNVHAADIRSDLYSLGCTFYFALSGQRPFPGGSTLETVLKHLNDDALPLEAQRADLPPALAIVVRRLMAKDPDQRFQTPADLTEALARIARAEGYAEHTALLPADGPDPGRVLEEPDNLPGTALVPDLAFWDGPATAPLAAAAGCEHTPKPVLPWQLGAAADLLTAPSASAPAPSLCAETPPEVCAVTAMSALDARVPADNLPIRPDRPRPFSPELRKSWRRWKAMVDAVARNGGAQDADEATYRTLHAQLLKDCRAELATSAGARSQVLQRLEAVVEPWLTLQALVSIDRGALGSLLLRCHVMDRELCGSGGIGFLVRWLVLLGGLAAAVVAGAWLSRQQAWALETWSGLRSLGIMPSTPMLWLLVLTSLVVLASLYLFSRFFRA
jgi:hypothetical protein